MPKRKGIPASSDAEDEQPEEEQEEAVPSTHKITTTSDGSVVVCEVRLWLWLYVFLSIEPFDSSRLGSGFGHQKQCLPCSSRIR
jgi:hypothetical protein